MLASIFSCCIRREQSPGGGQQQVDERTLLIPHQPEETAPPIPSYVVVDQDRLKERLGDIIKAKEGKMVNVNAPLPLNLHNQRFASSRAHYHHTHSRPDESGGTSSASGSRSASLSNSRNAENTYNNYSTVTATRSSALIYNSLAMDSRSPSRSSSRAGGLDGEDGMVEYLGGRDDEEESGSREVGAQGVILNVRLVDGMGARDQSQARWGRASTRGRSPGRAKGKDRDGDDDEGNVRSEEGELESTPRPFALPQTSRDLSPGESPMPMLPSPETPRPLKNPTSNVLEQPSKGDPGAFSFEIKDTGELAMSWGD